MIIVSNRLTKIFEWILGGGIKAVAFFPFIIMPTSTISNKVLINHEKIHLRQQAELLILPFYIWYLIALKRKGYFSISFEREAFSNEKNLDYLKTRRPFAFLKYL